MWMKDEGCREAIEDAWSQVYQGNPMSRVEGKVDRCCKNLKWWSKVAFVNVTQSLREKKELLRLAEKEAIRGGSFSRVQRLKKEISKLLVTEEQMWKQRSRALWLQEGDNNIMYFHNRASHQFRRIALTLLRIRVGSCARMRRGFLIYWWLPGEASDCVVSPKIEEATNWVVANLLELEGGGWNEQLVDDLFLPFEAQRIKSIPLCVTDQDDCLSWPRCKSGSYSVKTGYQLLCENELSSLPSSFDSNREAGIDVVIRNNEGQVLAALSKKVRLPATMEVLEMLAALRAATFARELGFSRVYFEGMWS
nr:hypothetical protein CFP56_14585 [Quercus suber]